MTDITILASVLLFLIGFAFVAISLSPFYALRSARAFEERGEEFLIIFKLRRPNRLNQREKGDRPVDFIGIVPPGKNFFGVMEEGVKKGLTKSHPEYWRIDNAAADVHPPTGVRTHRFPIIQLWVWYINLFFDVALVGVRGFYKIRRTSIEKTRYKKVLRTEGGVTETVYEIIPPKPPEDPEITDHVRTSPFQWVVPIVGAETTDRLSWNILMVINVQSINPWLQLNNHENWSQFLTAAVADATARGLRKLTISDMVGLVAEATKQKGAGVAGDEAHDKIIKSVYTIDERIKKIIGLQLVTTAELKSAEYSGAVQILSIEPRFRNDSDRMAFTEVWRSKQTAEAEVILGDAEAKRESSVIAAVAAEVGKNGEAGMLVQRMQAIENAAKFGSTLVFDTAGNQTSNVEKLLALQLSRAEKNQHNQQDSEGDE